MTLSISLKYSKRDGNIDTIQGNIDPNMITNGNIQLNENVFGIIAKNSEKIDLLVNGPQIQITKELNHVRNNTVATLRYAIPKKIEDKNEIINVSFIKYNGEILFAALHTAIVQENTNTEYILQILKKIKKNREDISSMEGDYKGLFSKFTLQDLENNDGILEIEDSTMDQFIKGKKIKGTLGESRMKISRI